MISTSGRNYAPIDAALLAKEAGVLVISLQSLTYREQQTRHRSGKRLEEVVDVIINTHIPVGDGLLRRQNMQYAPASTVIGSAILNAIFSQVIEQMADFQGIVPVFESNNVESNLHHNDDMIANYQNRINFT